MASVEYHTPQPAEFAHWAPLLMETRQRTLDLVAALSDEQLTVVHSTLLSPLVWDLGHIASFEDLWISRTFDVKPLRPDLIAVYDADETPRAQRGELDVLDRHAALGHLATVQARTLELLKSPGTDNVDLLELVIRHEQQHNETMLQALQIAHLPCPLASTVANPPADIRARVSGLELIEIPGANVHIGAGRNGSFAYDNEQPRHTVELEGFMIGRSPVTNGDWLEFITGGGYDRPEWWSTDGWAWRHQEHAQRPLAWSEDNRVWVFDELRELDLSAPVVHVSWFEADAFARANQARLPTEFEWEYAATSNTETGVQTPAPWGEAPVSREFANVDQIGGAPAQVGAFSAGVSASGISALIGDVWEWTQSTFDGYPGFDAYPYPEYSEQFFGIKYRVLRGGSWATRAHVASATFRNWDLPQRRQIFSGLRLAKDLT